MEIFVEEDAVAPMSIALELLAAAIHRSAPVGATQEDVRQPPGQFGSNIPEVHHLTGTDGTLHFQVVAEEVMKLLQRLDDEIVHREPDRPTPVRVGPEEAGARFRRLMVHQLLNT